MAAITGSYHRLRFDIICFIRLCDRFLAGNPHFPQIPTDIDLDDMAGMIVPVLSDLGHDAVVATGAWCRWRVAALESVARHGEEGGGRAPALAGSFIDQVALGRAQFFWN